MINIRNANTMNDTLGCFIFCNGFAKLYHIKPTTPCPWLPLYPLPFPLAAALLLLLRLAAALLTQRTIFNHITKNIMKNIATNFSVTLRTFVSYMYIR